MNLSIDYFNQPLTFSGFDFRVKNDLNKKICITYSLRNTFEVFIDDEIFFRLSGKWTLSRTGRIIRNDTVIGTWRQPFWANTSRSFAKAKVFLEKTHTAYGLTLENKSSSLSKYTFVKLDDKSVLPLEMEVNYASDNFGGLDIKINSSIAECDEDMQIVMLSFLIMAYVHFRPDGVGGIGGS